MISKKQYVEYLLSTPFNYTCTNLADHLEGVSHDVVNDSRSVRQEHFRPDPWWELVRGRMEDSPEAFLIAADSVQGKRYSRFIEWVKWQYSGAEHQTVKGIGVVNLVHSCGQAGDFYPIDDRVYAPDIDHKSKNDHFQEMFLHAVDHKALKARTILFEAGYASAENLKLIHRRRWTFFTTLKSNRLVSLSKDGHHARRSRRERRALASRRTAPRLQATDGQREVSMSVGPRFRPRPCRSSVVTSASPGWSAMSFMQH